MNTAQQIKRQLEKALNLDAQFWRNEIGFKILKKEPPKDAKIGLMQDNKQKLPYHSKQYMRYKANGMKRFTDGKRLKSYVGLPIVSKQTSFVDMTLTGRMWKGLFVKKADKFSVTMSFDPADKGKIIGNRKYGREVVGINDKNKALVENRIRKKLSKNMRQVFGKVIKVRVT